MVCWIVKRAKKVSSDKQTSSMRPQNASTRSLNNHVSGKSGCMVTDFYTRQGYELRAQERLEP
eukprot:1114678-Alexandrium_andersonii.AAC.1